MQCRSATLSTALIHVRITIGSLGKLFEDKKSCKALSAAEGSFENGWVDAGSIEERPLDFESSMAVFR
jgi:hypothetical protein